MKWIWIYIVKNIANEKSYGYDLLQLLIHYLQDLICDSYEVKIHWNGNNFSVVTQHGTCIQAALNAEHNLSRFSCTVSYFD